MCERGEEESCMTRFVSLLPFVVVYLKCSDYVQSCVYGEMREAKCGRHMKPSGPRDALVVPFCFFQISVLPIESVGFSLCICIGYTRCA